MMASAAATLGPLVQKEVTGLAVKGLEAGAKAAFKGLSRIFNPPDAPITEEEEMVHGGDISLARSIMNVISGFRPAKPTTHGGVKALAHGLKTAVRASFKHGKMKGLVNDTRRLIARDVVLPLTEQGLSLLDSSVQGHASRVGQFIDSLAQEGIADVIIGKGETRDSLTKMRHGADESIEDFVDRVVQMRTSREVKTILNTLSSEPYVGGPSQVMNREGEPIFLFRGGFHTADANEMAFAGTTVATGLSVSATDATDKFNALDYPQSGTNYEARRLIESGEVVSVNVDTSPTFRKDSPTQNDTGAIFTVQGPDLVWHTLDGFGGLVIPGQMAKTRKLSDTQDRASVCKFSAQAEIRLNLDVIDDGLLLASAHSTSSEFTGWLVPCLAEPSSDNFKESSYTLTVTGPPQPLAFGIKTSSTSELVVQGSCRSGSVDGMSVPCFLMSFWMKDAGTHGVYLRDTVYLDAVPGNPRVLTRQMGSVKLANADTSSSSISYSKGGNWTTWTPGQTLVDVNYTTLDDDPSSEVPIWTVYELLRLLETKRMGLNLIGTIVKDMPWTTKPIPYAEVSDFWCDLYSGGVSSADARSRLRQVMALYSTIGSSSK
jgi:hypothetical protein